MKSLAVPDPLPETMLTLARAGDIAVVSLTCKTIRERQASALGRYLSNLCEQVSGRLVLEVAGVGSFGCAWINELLTVSGQCRSFGADLVVLGMPERDARVMRTTGITRHLTLAHSRAEALAKLGAPSVAPWRLAVARLLDIPVGTPALSKAA
jgi:anti-anti-sigma regulatory factor